MRASSAAALGRRLAAAVGAAGAAAAAAPSFCSPPPAPAAAPAPPRRPVATAAAAAAIAAATTAAVAAATAAATAADADADADAGGSAPVLHPNLVVVDSRAMRVLFTVLRDASTLRLDFASHADRLMTLLAEEGLAHLPGVAPLTVATPCGAYAGLAGVPAHLVTAVSIVRSGDILLEAVRRVAPGVSIGKILIQRDEVAADKAPRLFYSKLPGAVRDAAQTVLLVDPMLATGGSACMAVRELVRAGVAEERIVFLCVVACPEGLAAIAAAHPRVRVVCAAVDDGLNAQRYIVPGLGDCECAPRVCSRAQIDAAFASRASAQQLQHAHRTAPLRAVGDRYFGTTH